MVIAQAQVEIGHIAVVHAFLDGEVEHGLLVAVVDACDARLVALLVIELQALDDGDRDVLQGSLHVAEHELLAVEQDFLHLFSVDGDVAVFIDLGTRNALDEFLDGRPFRRAVGFWVEDDGVLLHHNLCSASFSDQVSI